MSLDPRRLALQAHFRLFFPLLGSPRIAPVQESESNILVLKSEPATGPTFTRFNAPYLPPLATVCVGSAHPRESGRKARSSSGTTFRGLPTPKASTRDPPRGLWRPGPLLVGQAAMEA